MTQQIRQQGYQDGRLAAKHAFKDGLGRKSILALEAKCMKRNFMLDFKFGRDKALRMAMIYCFAWDKAIADFVFNDM